MHFTLSRHFGTKPKIKKGYEHIKFERTTKKKEQFLVEEIKRIGIRNALKEVGKSRGFLDFRREV